jgi:uncharacterized membrane protein
VAVGRQEVAADSAAEAEVSAAVDQAEVGDDIVRTKEFLSKVDHDRVVRAIREAEARSSGEIRVYIHRGKLDGDALMAARQRFGRLEMEKTRDRNAVLLFISPRAHKFAVVGDKAVHEKCGDTLWQHVVSKMADHFKGERFTDAIVGAIQDLGEVLSEHFPHHAGGENELPDNIIEG